MRPRPVVEYAVRPMIAGNRLPEVVRTVGICRLVGLLAVVPGPRQVVVEQPWGNTVTENRLNGRPADVQLGPPVMRGPDDGLGRDLQLGVQAAEQGGLLV